MATLTSLGFSIFSTYDGDGVRRASRDIRDLNDTINRTNGGLNSFTGRLSAVTTAAIALGPALLPIGEAAVAVTGGLTAMGVVAGTALGAYGVAAAGAITRTLEMAEAGKELSQSQSDFIGAVNRMKTAWADFITSTEDLTLSNATIVVHSLASAIRFLEPIVRAVNPLIRETALAFGDWVGRSDGLQRFVDLVIRLGVPALTNMTQAGRDMLAVLGFAFRAMLPFVIPLSEAIARGAASLRQWAEEGGFGRFVARVRENGPAVTEFFRALWAALGNIVAIMRELAPLSLQLATTLLRVIASVDPTVVAVLATAFLALKGAMTALLIPALLLRGVFGGTGIVSLLGGAAAAVTRLLGPLGLLVGVVILAWQHSQFFRDRLGELWAALQRLWEKLGPVVTELQRLWQKLQPLREAIGFVAGLILGIFIQSLTAAITTLTLFVGGLDNVIRWFTETMPQAIVNFITQTIPAFAGWIAQTALMFAGWVLQTGQAIAGWVLQTGQAIAGWVLQTAMAFAGWVVQTVQAIAGWVVQMVQQISQNFAVQTMLAIVNWVAQTIAAFVGWVANVVGQIASWAAQVVAIYASWVAQTVAQFVGWVAQTVATIASWVAQTVAAIVSWVAQTVAQFASWVAQTVAQFASWVAQTVAAIASWVAQTVAAIVSWVAQMVAQFASFVSQTVSAITSWAANMLGIFTDWVSDVISAAGDFISDIIDRFQQCWETIRDTASDLWNDILGVIEDAIDAILTPINMLISGFNNIAEVFGLPQIDPIEVNFAVGGMVPGFANGGVMNLRHGGTAPGYSPGRDRVPAMLSPGEGVLVPEAVRGLGGPSFIRDANNHFSHGRTGTGGPSISQLGFASGGVVPVQHFLTGGVAAALARAGVSPSLITQGEFSDGSLSAGTHLGSGVIDLGTTSPAILARLIAAGFAAWIRTPAQGFAPHIHAVLIGDPGLSGPAQAQVASFLAGGSGLGVGGGGGGFNIADIFGDIGELLTEIFNGASLADAIGGGGILGSIVGTITGLTGAGGMLAELLFSLVTREALETAFSAVRAAIDAVGLGDFWFANWMVAMAEKLLTGALDFIMNNKPEFNPADFAGGFEGASVQQWAPMAVLALARAGIAPNQLNAFLALMSAESGGNPMAINLTDSNAANGDPSRGLMQLIGATFAAYRDPSLPNNIFDPMANMVAAARYIADRYGGIVPGAPYGIGTPGGHRGWHIVGEYGPEWMKFRGGERVRSNQDLRDSMSGYGGRSWGGDINVNFYGKTDEAAVRRAEDHLVPKLRGMLQQKVCTR